MIKSFLRSNCFVKADKPDCQTIFYCRSSVPQDMKPGNGGQPLFMIIEHGMVRERAPG